MFANDLVVAVVAAVLFAVVLRRRTEGAQVKFHLPLVAQRDRRFGAASEHGVRYKRHSIHTYIWAEKILIQHYLCAVANKDT